MLGSSQPDPVPCSQPGTRGYEIYLTIQLHKIVKLGSWLCRNHFEGVAL